MVYGKGGLKPQVSFSVALFFNIYLFYSIYFIYLFILAASGLTCSMQGLRWRVRDLSLWRGLFVVACGLLSSCGTGSRAHGLCSLRHVALSLRRVSSVVVARGLSCPSTCGILVPRPGIEPVSLALEGRFFTTGPPGKSL